MNVEDGLSLVVDRKFMREDFETFWWCGNRKRDLVACHVDVLETPYLHLLLVRRLILDH